MVLSTLIGVAWSALGAPMPGPVGAYLRILADALTACALFAIGLGLSIDGLLANFGRSAALTIVKLVIMPLIVLGLSIALRLDPLYTAAAVICAGVPTAKTVYILAGEYRCEGGACRRDRLDDDAVLDRYAHRVDVRFGGVRSPSLCPRACECVRAKLHFVNRPVLLTPP